MGGGELRPHYQAADPSGFFIARVLRALSFLEHRVRKLRLQRAIAVIELATAVVILIAAIVELVTKLI